MYKTYADWRKQVIILLMRDGRSAEVAERKYACDEEAGRACYENGGRRTPWAFVFDSYGESPCAFVCDES